ncbi:MAG TPA: hypothetical protein VI911_10105 [Patescibacteria group bacterium]|nr:hypothetical protein [Patescibacteria group bacterium]
MRKKDDIFCGDGREDDLSDDYYNDQIVSLEEVDFDLEEDEDETCD